ncbi:hypothetical protein CROQUDRAFT_649914 [Cronartium quercuum f. sp. fusiforme G11]|uniref:Uncharacterized protein n=1 Tax=Cronartium quercuum f. sp. fusiforme G11 TaxID=708437 RepID=A0A9P6NS87_9BASI|nr:hypothetical protein CROQUDRAFT_649914 [Cronartium quercuum f. sp. fusiforme G11]
MSFSLSVLHHQNSTTNLHTMLGKNLPPQTHFKLSIKGRPTAILSPGPQDPSTLQSLQIENEKQKHIKARLETKPVIILSRFQPNSNPYKIYHIETLSDTHKFEIERKDLLERLLMKEFQFQVMKLGTERSDGLRPSKMICRVLFHELAHIRGELVDHWRLEEELDHHCSVVSNSSLSSNTVHQLIEFHQDNCSCK